MLQKFKTLNDMHSNVVVAVVRGKNKEEAIEISQQAYLGGIKSIEVTFSTPGAEEAIATLVQQNYAGMIVGAGTVLDEETARTAILKGANYVVSPHVDSGIARMCNRYGVPYLPGCGSVTEILQALTYGVDVVKLFPGSLMGPGFMNDVRGPIPHVQLMPSGGVSVDNVSQWLKAGAFAVGLGSSLTKHVSKGDYSSVQQVAKEFMEKITLYKVAAGHE